MNDTNSQEVTAAQELFRRAQQAMLDMFRMPPVSDPDKTVETVGAKLLESQKRAFDLMNGFAGVWKDLAERGIAGPDAWKKVLDEASKMLTGSSAEFDAAGLLEAWRKNGELMLNPFKSWQEAAGKLMPPGALAWPPGPAAWALGGTPGGVAPPFAGPSGMAGLFGAPGGGAGAAFGNEMMSWLSSPGFGIAREYQSRIGALFEHWIGYQQKDFEYKQSLTGAWAEAFRNMTERMGEMLREGKQIEQPRDLIDLWIEVADDVFTRLFCTEEFSLMQSELLNAGHRVRLARRQLTEELLKAYDLPTREDLEEAHRVIHQLRRELRATQREIAALRDERSEA